MATMYGDRWPVIISAEEKRLGIRRDTFLIQRNKVEYAIG
jgi:hypothetical protein